MVYAALGAICFTLVSLVPVLGGEAESVEMEFRQLGKWGGATDNCSLSYLEVREVSGIPVVFCSQCTTLLLSDPISKQDGQHSSQGILLTRDELWMLSSWALMSDFPAVPGLRYTADPGEQETHHQPRGLHLRCPADLH